MIKTFRIFGAGEWGLAVANHLSCLDNKVEVFFRNDNKVNEYNKSLFCKNLNLSFNKNIVFRSLEELNHLSNSEDNFNMIASSSSGFSDIINSYNTYFKSCESIIWLTKGLDHSKGSLFHEIIDIELSPTIKKCIISGPSFAKDLIARKPLRVSIASTCGVLSDSVIKAMETKNFKLEKTFDIIGVEISGVIKNISGILAGILTANLYPNEYIEELISLSQKDVKSITRKIAKKQDSYLVTEDQLEKTVLSPACYGDIHLTCYFNASRNRQLGLKIVGEYNIKKIISKLGTVEGYLSTATLNAHEKMFGESKIVQAAHRILYLDDDPKTVLNQLFT